MSSSSKMRLMFVVRSLGVAGSERQLVNLVVGLSKRGHSVAVVVLYDKGVLQSELENHEVELFSLHKKNTWQNFRPLLRLRKLIGDFNPDIIHSYGTVPNCLTAFLGIFDNSRQYVLGVRTAFIDYKRYGMVAVFCRKLEIFLSGFADLIIANSHAGKSFTATSGIREDKIVVVPNGIDTNRFFPDFVAREKHRELLQIDSKQLLIGIVGRYDILKDHQNYFNAVLRVVKNNQQVYSVAIGDGEWQNLDFYKNEIQGSRYEKHFLWLGAQLQIEKWINALDILVLSSCVEGFPNVIGEAMACDVPVVATDVGDTRYIVDDSSRIVPARDSIKLCEAIERLVSNMGMKKSQMQDGGRERVLQLFSLDNLVINTETLFYELLEQ